MNIYMYRFPKSYIQNGNHPTPPHAGPPEDRAGGGEDGMGWVGWGWVGESLMGIYRIAIIIYILCTYMYSA